jgi:hypothetical protein
MNLTTDYNLEEVLRSSTARIEGLSNLGDTQPLVVTNEREMEWKEEGTHPLLLRVYDVNKESEYSEQYWVDGKSTMVKWKLGGTAGCTNNG